MSEEMNAVAVMDKPAEAAGQPIILEKTPERAEENPNKFAGLETFDLSPAQKRYLVTKRICDFVISLLSLIILLIPFVIISLIQKITSPKEPVFFRQIRVGKNGKSFLILKFRSMKSSAPHDCPTKDFSGGEQYITKFGRFLRDSSIDELPQLLQVLTGERDIIETTKKNVGFSRVVAA